MESHDSNFLEIIMKALPILISTLVLSLLVACGGGGGGGGSTSVPTTPPASSGTVSGTAVKGPVVGGTMAAYAIVNGAMGSQLGSATTDTQGNFQLSIGSYAGPIMLQLSGGSYVDEATGVTMSMSSGNVMTAVIPAIASGGTASGIQVTPLTSMAQSMAKNMAGGMSDTNIAAANLSMGNFFMVNDILHTLPMNPLVSGSGATATQDMKNYGMAIAAMSQLAKDTGVTSSSSMITAMMNDASDGIMNGMMGTNTITMGGMMGGSFALPANSGTSGLSATMGEFMGSSMNKSGVTASDMNALMIQLANKTNGKI